MIAPRFARTAVIVGVLTLAVVSSVAYFHCFRRVSHDNVRLGIVTHVFKFCQLRQITVDANRDGLVDGRALIETSDNSEYSSHFVVKEGWESINLDGTIDLHYFYREPDRQLVLELDLDKDGIFEKILAGEEAETRFRNLRRVSPAAMSALANGE